MRKLLALAPFALLAACGGSNDAATADQTATVEAPVAAEPAMTATDNARTAVQWAGAYTGAEAGAAVTLTLNPDSTYALSKTPAGGTATVTNGTFSWYRDGGRVLLDDAGGKAVYAVGDGVIFKMADKDAATTGTLPRETALIRDPAVAAVPAAGAPAPAAK